MLSSGMFRRVAIINIIFLSAIATTHAQELKKAKQGWRQIIFVLHHATVAARQSNCLAYAFAG
jgi:hypothetical protein